MLHVFESCGNYTSGNLYINRKCVYIYIYIYSFTYIYIYTLYIIFIYMFTCNWKDISTLGKCCILRVKSKGAWMHSSDATAVLDVAFDHHCFFIHGSILFSEDGNLQQHVLQVEWLQEWYIKSNIK